MRVPVGVVIAALAIFPALAQEKSAVTEAVPLPAQPAARPTPAPEDKCAPIRSQLASNSDTTISRLFLWTRAGYKEIPRDAPFLFASEYVLSQYTQSLPFIFAPARRHAEKKQYLAIRTRSSADTENTRVLLWKNKEQFRGDVSFGTYQEYHLNPTTDDRVLRQYHKWGSDRSDKPETTRNAFAFSQYPSDFLKKIFGIKALEERRLLTIPFDTSEDHQTCFKFTMRPNPKEILPDETDNDQISLTKSFTITIREVRAFNSGPGDKFTIQYEKK